MAVATIKPKAATAKFVATPRVKRGASVLELNSQDDARPLQLSRMIISARAVARL